MDINTNLPRGFDLFDNNSAKYFNICSERLLTSNNEVDNWQFFIHFYRFFVSWFVPLLIMFGEVGTLLCLIVLLKRRTGNAETRMWFIALSIADMYSLAVGLSLLYSARIQLIFPSLFIQDEAFQFDMRHRNAFSCYALNGMVYFGLLVSTWIQVGISVLRVLSVKAKTPNANSRKSKKYAIALGVCVFICVAVTCVLIGLSIEYDFPEPCRIYKMCKLKDGNKYFFYTSLTIKVLLPTIFLLACSILIISHLKKFKRRFSNRENNSSAFNSIVRKRVKQKYISYTLLGMNFTFFLLTLPFEVYKIFYFYNATRVNDSNVALIRTIDKLLNIILYANNATNWLFYFMLGQRFRQSMVHLICQKYSINCSSFVSTFRRLNTSLRSNRRTKSTPVQCTLGKNSKPLLKPTESPEEMFTLVASQPKFHCTYPAAQNTFPKFY